MSDTTDFVPTTEYARNAYQHSVMVSGPEMRKALGAEFDRWLDAHDREVAARTLREAAEKAFFDRERDRTLHGYYVLQALADAIEKGELNV